MPREPIPTWTFAVVVVRLGPRFLLVHERKHGGGWYLPAGRVEPGETIEQAAVRETLEEAGIPIAIDGILRIEHSPRADGHARMRVIFHAHPADDTPPKSAPDEESLEAGWFLLEELESLSLRGSEVLGLLHDVERGAPVHPRSLLRPEGEPLLPR
ncbi:NUDIX hydrolase [Paraliomyxa miuraensis]|uniref:NUDIX hydrolase n=1 Tax=Paraliomyxa miuraensis TaxID=376150 RepID=UPI0022545B6E|nr:NUDIX domain-containing protein [Paraliomyxa miuraensis]MCX4243305.1 NUDIX domain-containing protein [Paraliomyxa miuraensis]